MAQNRSTFSHRPARRIYDDLHFLGISATGSPRGPWTTHLAAEHLHHQRLSTRLPLLRPVFSRCIYVPDHTPCPLSCPPSVPLPLLVLPPSSTLSTAPKVREAHSRSCREHRPASLPRETAPSNIPYIYSIETLYTYICIAHWSFCLRSSSSPHPGLRLTESVLLPIWLRIRVSAQTAVINQPPPHRASFRQSQNHLGTAPRRRTFTPPLAIGLSDAPGSQVHSRAYQTGTGLSLLDGDPIYTRRPQSEPSTVDSRE